ncbi:sensor histidine kinase [Pseudonocardia nantongensis]|uniref:sensor histidine kinase n=1 Tax=Pseudonocardia nantongensis TaxID=1181885 RepID=UPI0039798751
MAAGTFSGVLGRHRRARFVTGHLADLLVVTAVCVVVVALTRPAYVAGRVDLVTATSVLTLVAAAVGSAAAIVALVTGRLSGDPRPSWFGAGLLLYGVVLLPMSALVVREGGPTARLAVLSMLVVGMGVLLGALRPPARLGAWGGWVLVGLALLVGAVVVLHGQTRLTALLGSGPLTSIVAQTGWSVLAVSFLLDGYRRQSRVRSRLALGLLVIALSQLSRAVVPAEPVADLTYPSLRVVGTVVVLSALLTLVLRTVAAMQDDYDRSQEMIGDATRLLERAVETTAERDHELRNGLAGLAGAAYLLSHRDGGSEADQVREALLAELGRLRHMLENPEVSGLLPDPDGPLGPGERVPRQRADPGADEHDRLLLDLGELPTGPAGAGTGRGQRHAVGPVLRQLVTLRTGQDIPLTVDPELPDAAAPADVTRQVVTGLLANCDRHAPGAPVTIRAQADDDGAAVRIDVRDQGPGLPEGRQELRIARGKHDERAGGSGLGLHISVGVLQEIGGTLVLRSVDDPQGCLASFTLPAVR